MKALPKVEEAGQLVRAWSLPPAATLGSSVRAAGLFLEIRARLPGAAKKALTIKSREIILRMSENAAEQFAVVSTIVTNKLEGIERLPVIPREIEDILTISSTERHRWLADGRLPSAGTRTVNLRGRARKITFHVFDPRLIEDVLDHGLVDTWREEDAIRAAENRRRAAWKRKLTSDQKNSSPVPIAEGEAKPDLVGWEEFAREGLLRSAGRDR